MNDGGKDEQKGIGSKLSYAFNAKITPWGLALYVVVFIMLDFGRDWINERFQTDDPLWLRFCHYGLCGLLILFLIKEKNTARPESPPDDQPETHEEP